MKFGTIGAGTVALAFGREALATGHEVILSSRSGPESLASKVAELGHGASAATVEEAARQDYVLLAVPWRNVEDALRGLPAWNGRVLIDATTRRRAQRAWDSRCLCAHGRRAGRDRPARPDREGIVVKGFFLNHPDIEPKIEAALRETVPLVASGAIQVPIVATYPLSSLREAVLHAQRGGKVLLDLHGT